MKYHTSYYGCNIYYHYNGWTCWHTYLPDGRSLSSDTLDGLKRYIKSELKRMGYKVRK